jgi:hypothetical protein
MKQMKSIYHAPTTDACLMMNESVMAASVENLQPGKRYDAGDDLTSPAASGGIPLGMGGGGTGSLLKMGRQLLPLLALGLATASCSNEAEAPTDKPTTDDGKVYVSFTVLKEAIGETSATRTVYGLDARGKDGDMLTVAWNATASTETIGVIGVTGSAITNVGGLPGTERVSDKEMTFGGLTTAGSDSYHCYYPYQVDGSSTNPFFDWEFGWCWYDLGSQTCDVTAPLANLQNYDVMYATAAAPADGAMKPTHACAALRFVITLTAGAPAIKTWGLERRLRLCRQQEDSSPPSTCPTR